MKKMIAVVTALFLLGALSACGEKKDNLQKPNPETCNHEWVDASCDKPDRCNLCGLESGKPLGHEYYNRVCGVCSAELSEDEVIDLGNVMIMGDSISTFEGYSYEMKQFWYHEGGREDNMTDVTSVEETWWDILMSNCDGNLVRNQSCSGSTFVEARYKAGEFEKAYNSFWDRLNRYLLQEDFFKNRKIDTFIFFGGTNDNGACQLGEVMYEGWTDEDLKYFAPAYAHYIYQVKKCCPEAKLVSMVDNTLADVAPVMKEINEHYGVLTVELDGFDEIAPHPTVRGMKQIEAVLRNALK